MRLINQENHRTNILPLLTVGTFGLHLLGLLLLTFDASLLQQLKTRPSKTQSLVQLVDGSVLTVETTDHFKRNPETIRRFVGETMTLLFTWSQKQQPKTVLQTISSELVADGFRSKFESQITNLNPRNQFENINRGTENVLVLQRISQPTEIGPLTEIGPGKWKVEIYANSLIFGSSDELGKSTPFNKQILVRTIDKQATSLPNAPQPLNLAVHRLGQAGLEVYNICEIQDTKCS
ncbi:MAG: hypothetical protein DSM106950_14085 [Stigonema ocellatum SAG 48.90 = DSM 106950]|nr:hypothetical protein [Stigonema ocellatum SAG 48.90 = DSM 106950]